MNKKSALPLSVILNTYNRAPFLQSALDSLTTQTLRTHNFEVIVIDDGSSDNTKEIVLSFSNKLNIRYFYQQNSGIASARNHGIYAAIGKILFFFDDDDIAAPDLLAQHLKTHKHYPEDHFAVLNYTTWERNLRVTPVMKYITTVGCHLFSYPGIKHGSRLDYTFFWGGRSSCKRSFLIEHGVFNPIFRFGCEDAELGYRLSKHGLTVLYNSKAISYMAREITLDDFCQRLFKQGRSQYYFSMLHNDSEVAEWCEINGAKEKWMKMEFVYESLIKSTRDLENIVLYKLQNDIELDNTSERLLYQAYQWTFTATKIKGIVAAGNGTIAGMQND